MFDVPVASATAWILLAVAALIVGLSKTAIPGATTVAVAMFASVLPARESTGALLVLLLIGDLLAIWSYRRDVDWRTLFRLIPTVLVGVVAGAIFLDYASDSTVRRVIGIVLLALLALTLVRRALASRRARPQSRGLERRPVHPVEAGGYGALGGFTTMVANAGGPVMSLYFLAMRLPVTRFLGTTAYFFFAVNLVKLPFQIGIGLLSPHILLLDLVLAPLVIVAAWGGRALARRIDQRLFDALMLILTGIGALNLMFG
ncbi:sulfite exporter TauE/SafE family protein [Devriesea agamarum]|uniref:sulfite exporter TauE/SafE family protein n=1 Tax=Devriesea agamarum TaxID=472569 RepID=UPI00071C5075|nr:sulfite exporter TauE/SafE family protein [Devriesea agamarum]